MKGMTLVYLTLSAIAAATKGSSGGSGTARAAAPGEVRVNGALQRAMETLGSNQELLQEVTRLRELQ